MLQLNENSVWYGGPQQRIPKDAHRNLAELRRLIRAEKHAAAERLVSEAFFAVPKSMRHYEPLGSCTMDYAHEDRDVTDYSRVLDIGQSQVTVTYRCHGVEYRRDVIASFPDSTILIRHSSSAPVRFVLRLDRVGEDDVETNNYLDTVEARDGRIILHATPGGRDSNALCLGLGVVGLDNKTTTEVIGHSLVVVSASCLVAIGAQTTYRHAQVESATLADIDRALKRPWSELVERHRADYKRLFGRMSLRMWPDACHLPTDERIRSSRDAGLVALYHNYGRYLLISSSRDSSKALPATLQGIWNPSFAPPWGSKYTININLQMNYWPAAPCGLAEECARPVVDLLERMAARGQDTAKQMYGCRGWCAHHNTDIWADTCPQDRWMPATLWPLGGVWLTVDMVRMLRYQYDEALHERLFRVQEGCVEFLLDFLIPSACGQYLVTSPSLSPENAFRSESGEKGIFCEGSVLDMTLVQTTFEQFLHSIDTLRSGEHRLLDTVQTALAKIPPVKVNRHGLIQEWGLKDHQEDEPGHRHVSHLFGLYPGETISPFRSPDLAEAAKKVLQRRATHGGGHTGWSRAWLLNLHARLFDAGGCGQHMDLLLGTSTLPNLLDTHPPFQIDGNFGGCAGILECLVQSTERDEDGVRVVEIRLLPACPRGWTKGKLERVRTKQGWFVSFEWEDGLIKDSFLVEPTDRQSSEAHVILPDGERRMFKHTS
ncbi:hypothetical protein AK830_g2062 [Neonectria ditissima]|uniref:Uncharacterized protein n=1 Tax=Neonectria ditissima TaxID=78410 RepID=A0A0P7BGQ1_9HYPO|nr:hypothetical protein AK830_g2062 [Neonectria ditissima]